jgi:hypothetical protein
MQKQFYFLSPVEVVKVTLQNLHEVAEWCGGKVASTESRRVPGRMDSYVWVPTPKGTAISWAFPGMFVTKRLVRTVKNDELRVTYAVFRKDYFEKNYFDSPLEAVDETWGKQKSKKSKDKDLPEQELLVRTPEEELQPVVNINLNVQNKDDIAEAVEVITKTLGGTVVPADEEAASTA